jgi:hypothetical protein
MQLCWHCGANPADPERVRIVPMHRGVTNDAVRVPACDRCADLLDERARCGTPVGRSFVVAGAVGLVAAVIAARWASWVAATAAFVLFAGGGFVFARRTGRRMARWTEAWSDRRLTLDHPDVVRRTREGWLVGRSSRWTTPPAVIAPLVFKKCSFCDEIAPTNAHAGETCPHCGALWTQELWGRRAS